MNWKTTLTLGLVFAGLIGLRSVWKPEVAADPLPESLFPATNDEYSRIEIQPAGAPEVILERTPDARTGLSWFITKPVARPAWEPYVMEMLGGLREITTASAIRPHQDPPGPEITGVEKPDLVVKVQTSGGKRTLKFGRPMVKDPSQRWLRVEPGDPNLYGVSQKAFEAFTRSISDLRHRGVAFFAPHRVGRIEVSNRFERARMSNGKPVLGSDGKPILEPYYSISEFEQIENKSGLQGWYWVRENGQPLEEHLGEERVQQFLSDLSSLLAEDYRDGADLAAFGLDAPIFKFRVWLRETSEPIELHVGKTEEVAGKAVTYVRTEGTQEVALIEAVRLEGMPKKRDEFRSTNIYEITAEEIASIEIANDLARVRIAREVRKDAQGVRERWVVEEPAGLNADRAALEEFLKNLFYLSIKEGGFLGVQPDLKLFGLEPPGLTVTYRLNRRDGTHETQVFKLGYKGSGDAYLMKPNCDEVFAIAEGAFKFLDRLDLNFRDPSMFNVPRNSIREIDADIEDEAQLGRRSYFWVSRDGAGNWSFRDSVNRGPVDAERMNYLLTKLSYVRAHAFISRRKEVAREHGLDSKKTAGKVEIVYDDGIQRRKVLRLSRPIRGAGGARVRYAKFEDDPIVFAIDPDLVERLQRGVSTPADEDSENRK